MWHQRHACVRIRILLGKLLTQHGEFALCLRQSHAAPQSRDQVKEAGSSPPHPGLIVLSERREHICIAIQLKPGRRNSNDCVRFTVINKRHADSAWITAVSLLPQARADDRDAGRAELVLSSLERAAF
jgi:hypothetical protein